MVNHCQWHLCQNQLSGRQKKWCSGACKNKFYVTQNRKLVKERLVEMFGGSCERCGYSKSLVALHFHHPDNNKEFGISRSGATRSWEKVVREAKKCQLVCANCHAELHSNLI